MASKRKLQNATEKEQTASKYFKKKTDEKDKNSASDSTGSSQGKKLACDFYNVECLQLANALLGKYLVRWIGSKRVSGKIVETEAYLGAQDKGAHSYKGKRTERNEAMFMQPGTAYVYNIYGKYCCLNISSKGDGCAVLIRALEPTENIEVMRETRRKNSTKKQNDKEMTNGPSKLCQALQITKSEFNQIDLNSSNVMWLESGETIPEDGVIKCARINIDYAEEWKDRTFRFYILGSKFVSVRDKDAEQAKSTSTH